MSIIFPVSPSLMSKVGEEAFSYLESGTIERNIAYLLHSDYRNAVSVVPWLEQQVREPTPAVTAFANNITTGKDFDDTAMNVLIAVNNSIKYVGDVQRWGMPEYWSTADETLTATTHYNGVVYGPMEGDCEDGAVLTYVLCRLKGIPASRLLLFCGDVLGGGHCFLSYRPMNFPLNFVFLDWCYYPTMQPVGERVFYYVAGTAIIGESPVDGRLDTRYEKMWFSFNEEHSTLSMTLRH